MIDKIITLKNPLRYLFVFLLIFGGAAYYFHGQGVLNDSSKTLLTVTSFVFGFYINNLLSQARSRHSKILESLREEGGYIRAIYFNLKACFDPQVTKKIQLKIDEYLTSGMDYRMCDYAKSGLEFEELHKNLMNLKPETKQQDGAYGQIARIISETSKSRSRVETMVKERVSVFEWITVSTLLALVVYFVFTLNTGTMLSIVLTSLISTALSMLLVVLYSLDSLRWKEDKWFWGPQEELFVSLGLIPYYPKILVDLGRVKLKKGQAVRLVEYPHPYPNVSDKRVILFERWKLDKKQGFKLSD